MIVRRGENILELITQPDHAALAGEILTAWRSDDLPSRPTRDVLLFATREHDRGWEPIDAAPGLDSATGRPYDFVATPVALRQALWPRAVASLDVESPYAAALVAQHAITAYDHYDAAPEWHAFFQIMRSGRDASLARSGQTRAQLETDYPLLRLADLISLAFCNGWTDAMSAFGRRVILAGDTMQVTPDPFAGREVVLRVAMRTIPDRPYASDADLAAAIAAAPPAFLEGRARGAE